MKDMIDCPDCLCERVIGAAIAVHRELGPGLLESVYERALMYELQDRGIKARNQVEVPIVYHGHNLGAGFRADVIVEQCLLLELKATTELIDLYTAQIISYQKFLNFKRGYLMNFNVPKMVDGIKRISL